MYQCDLQCAKWKRWEEFRARRTVRDDSIEAKLEELGYLREDPQQPGSCVSLKPVAFEHNPWRRLWQAGGVLELIQWRSIRHEFLFPHDEYEHVDGELVRRPPQGILRLQDPHFFHF